MEKYGARAKAAGKSIGLRINPECSTQEGHAIYDPCAPGSRLGVTKENFEKGIIGKTELLPMLDGLHFHTLCEQDSDDLEKTLDAVEEKFGKYLSRQNVLFVIFTIVLSLLLYMRDINGVETNKFLLLGFVAIYAIIADYEHLMMLIAFILPLTNGLPGNYILPILCVLMVIKGGSGMKVPQIVWWSFFLVAIYEVIHVGLLAASIDVPSYVGYVSFLFLMLFIGGSYDSRSDEAKNALSFCLGSVVMLTIILLNFNQLVGEYFLEGSVRMGNVNDYLGEETMTLRTNPNNIGLYSIAAISISFVLWYYKKIPIWALVFICRTVFYNDKGRTKGIICRYVISCGIWRILFLHPNERKCS